MATRPLSTASTSATLGLAIGLACGVMPGVAHAEAGDDGAAIVVTGSRTDEPEPVGALKTPTALLDTPQSVTVISRQQLDDQAVSSLNDALRYVPGITLGQGEGHRDQIVLRGQASTADFYQDGLRDDAQYYRPLYNTERVEVLKGANALLFGRGGGGGIINRVSKVARPGASRSAFEGSADSFGGWTLAGDANLAAGESTAVRLNATYESLASHRDGFAGHFLGLAPTASLRIGSTGTLTAAYEYVEDRRLTDRGVPSFGGAPITGFENTLFGDPAVNQSRVTAHLARLDYAQELAPGLSLHLAGSYASYDKYYGNILPGTVNAARTSVSLSGYRSTAVRDNWIGQANLVWTGPTGPIRHTLLAGVEAADQSTAASRDDARFGGAAAVSVPLGLRIAVPASTWVVLSASRSDVRALSAYVQDQIELAPWIQIIAGARYDSFRISADNLLAGAITGRTDGKWSPRLGLVLKPQRSLSLYASYARSFLPQTGDQFTTLAANLQSLAPEEFRNLEAGLKWDLVSGLSLAAAAFQIDRTNTRATDPVTGNPVLTGSSRVRGLEASLSGHITPQWQVSLGYALQDGQIRTTTTVAPAGRRLDKLPRHQATVWTRYDLSRRFGLGLGMVHQSSQFASISNAVRLPGFVRIDAAAFATVTERFRVQLNIENLLDTRYFASAHTDTNIATGKPLSLRLSARVSF